MSELYPNANLVAFFSVFAPSLRTCRRARRRFASKDTDNRLACSPRNIFLLLRGATSEPKKPPNFRGGKSMGGLAHLFSSSGRRGQLIRTSVTHSGCERETAVVLIPQPVAGGTEDIRNDVGQDNSRDAEHLQ